jgi:hypothetical protein
MVFDLCQTLYTAIVGYIGFALVSLYRISKPQQGLYGRISRLIRHEY